MYGAANVLTFQTPLLTLSTWPCLVSLSLKGVCKIAATSPPGACFINVICLTPDMQDAGLSAWLFKHFLSPNG